MKLVTFGIDEEMNLTVHFPGFIHPNKQNLLYQIEALPVPVTDLNEKI